MADNNNLYESPQCPCYKLATRPLNSGEVLPDHLCRYTASATAFNWMKKKLASSGFEEGDGIEGEYAHVLSAMVDSNNPSIFRTDLPDGRHVFYYSGIPVFKVGDDMISAQSVLSLVIYQWVMRPLSGDALEAYQERRCSLIKNGTPESELYGRGLHDSGPSVLITSFFVDSPVGTSQIVDFTGPLGELTSTEFGRAANVARKQASWQKSHKSGSLSDSVYAKYWHIRDYSDLRALNANSEVSSSFKALLATYRDKLTIQENLKAFVEADWELCKAEYRKSKKEELHDIGYDGKSNKRARRDALMHYLDDNNIPRHRRSYKHRE